MKTLALHIMVVIFAMTKVSSAASFFYYTSSPESWVGGGKTDLMQNPTHTLLIYGLERNGVHLDIRTSTEDWYLHDNWSVFFSTPETMRVGEKYFAARWGFQEPYQGGFSFFGSGRGNNQLSGWFIIHEIELDTRGTPTKLAVDFIQYDEMDRDKWNWGNIRINSDIPLNNSPVPEPAIFSLLTLSSLTLVRRRR